jgi:hypothetical protein
LTQSIIAGGERNESIIATRDAGRSRFDHLALPRTLTTPLRPV